MSLTEGSKGVVDSICAVLRSEHFLVPSHTLGGFRTGGAQGRGFHTGRAQAGRRLSYRGSTGRQFPYRGSTLLAVSVQGEHRAAVSVPGDHNLGSFRPGEHSLGGCRAGGAQLDGFRPGGAQSRRFPYRGSISRRSRPGGGVAASVVYLGNPVPGWIKTRDGRDITLASVQSERSRRRPTPCLAVASRLATLAPEDVQKQGIPQGLADFVCPTYT